VAPTTWPSDVINTIAHSESSLLAATGGLTGIRDRVSGIGGTFSAGRDDPGDWRVSVRFPCHLGNTGG
jgi:signal transduction histidine kinase